MAMYDPLAKQYSDWMGEEGDEVHKNTIDPNIYKFVGDLQGKFIYDIGCGNGYMARYFAKNGAKVFASDVSSELVKIAKEKSEGLDIVYSVHDALDFSKYNDSTFDAVVMNMVIQYVEDLETLFNNISRVLKPGGKFAFSMSHFLRPPDGYSKWVVDKLDNKERLFLASTGYLEKGKRIDNSWLDNATKLILYNHPLNEIVNTLSKFGLYVSEVEEPVAAGWTLRNFSDDLKKSAHMPLYIIFGVTKKSD